MATPKMERTQTPGIYRRGGRYVVVWRHKGRQHKEFLRTMAEAREAKRQRQGGDRRKRPRLRFRDYAPEWIQSYRGRTTRGFSESTRSLYRRDLNDHVLPYFGSWWLDDIEPPDVRDWFGWLENRGVSVAGVRRAKAVLSVLFSSAKEDGKVRHNPVAGTRYVPSRDVPAPRTLRPLTLAELDRFIRALPVEWRLLFLLLAHSGLRIGELLGLTWDRVHLGDDPHLTICEQVYQGERKGLKSSNAYRSVPLSSRMAQALVAWRDRTQYPAALDPVFASATGTPLGYSNVYNRALVPARQAAGIPAAEVGGFHAFRRTLSSLVHESGEKSDRQLCDWLGHHDPAFTVREYVGTLDAGIGAADFLDELIPVTEWAAVDDQLGGPGISGTWPNDAPDAQPNGAPA